MLVSLGIVLLGWSGSARLILLVMLHWFDSVGNDGFGRFAHKS